MCLLVISNCLEKLDRSRLSGVSTEINKVISAARLEMRPLAFLQSSNGMSFDELGVRIGRYEPIFTIRGHRETLPSGLIDFVVRNATNQIQLAGVAVLSHFDQLSAILLKSGYTTTIEQESVLMLDSSPVPDADGVQGSSQLMEYDTFAASPFV